MLFSLKTLTWTAAVLPFALAAPTHPGQLKIRSADSSADVVPNAYIVVYEPEVSAEAIEAHHAAINKLKKRDGSTAEIDNTYHIDDFKGFSIKADEATIAEIAASPEVAFVEPDQVISVDDDDNEEYQVPETQQNAPWGLGRISHRNRGSREYVYDSSAGYGTRVYVADTGIMTSHRDYGGRAIWGANFVGGANRDGHGHGTHCAGTIGAQTYGVSKDTTMIAVKVLGDDGSGFTSGIIKGFQWIVDNARSLGATQTSVMSVSLGGGRQISLNNAAEAVHNAGLTTVVAAGNDNEDAYYHSPASAPAVITVAASDSNDRRSQFRAPGASNWGSVVDIFAPGSSILSCAITSNTATASWSGTSMATPHVAGLAAYLMAHEGLRGSNAITRRIKALGTTGVITDTRGTVNLLAYNGGGN